MSIWHKNVRLIHEHLNGIQPPYRISQVLLVSTYVLLYTTIVSGGELIVFGDEIYGISTCST